MTRICHLVDGSAGFEQRVAIAQLVDHLPSERFASTLATMSPEARRLLDGSVGQALQHAGPSGMAAPQVGKAVPQGDTQGNKTVPQREKTASQWEEAAPQGKSAVPQERAVDGRCRVLRLPAGLSIFARPACARALARRRFDLIHAWSVEAACTARMANDTPLVVSLFDPAIPNQQIKVLRSIARDRHFAIACGTQLVRRRLIEGGVPSRLCVLIRPGVDFEYLNKNRQNRLRDDLNIQPDRRVILLAEPITRQSGAFDAFWAGHLRFLVTQRFCVIVPGCSPEQRRIARFSARLSHGLTSLCAAPGVPFEKLVAMADILLLAPRENVAVTSIAWAMAAKTAVIATAVDSVAELISHRINGLLVNPGKGQSPVLALSRMLRDESDRGRMVDQAHGEAFELFSLWRCVERHQRLYHCVVGGQAVEDDSPITQPGALSCHN